MPKATSRRVSAQRAEPYPIDSPADKPKPTTTRKSISKPKAKKVLGEKTSSEINKAIDISSEDDAASKPKKPKTSTKKTDAKPTENDASKTKPSSFLDIHLDGESDGEIACYDTCSTVRAKINALLGKDNHKKENLNPQDLDKDGNPKPFTKASFGRAINERSDTINRFLGPKKMKLTGGAESSVYPSAYAFFEKKRIFEGKKKSATRLKIEAE